MNEPGSERGSTTRVVELHPTTTRNAGRYGARSKPTWGITVGIAELMSAGQVWMLVTGSHKRDILSRALTDPIGPDLPATFLREHPRCRVITDRSAGEE